MTEANDAAFARPAYLQERDISGTIYYGQEGLNKREYFAAMALQGLLARSGVYVLNTVAYVAVEAADKLIEELNKTKQP